MALRESYNQLYQRACERKGGPDKLEILVTEPLSSEELAGLPDNLYLSAFTMKVFQSGFVWRVVRNKWPHFERLFFNFDIEKMLLMPDEMYEAKAKDPDIIRNLKKVMTIRDNALMIDSVSREHGSFGRFIAKWPQDDVVGLWQYLKKHGARLGGNTGPYALRAMGKDTFILSSDVESYLRAQHIVDGSLTSKRSLTAIQTFFNELREESGRSLQALSQIISYSSGDNFVHVDTAT
ncbi:DNA-3-methyladenine glycosylase I [Aestuariibacter sp. AA17]|uniref:DNA-3-methyladenine glycosylase I n=1 Tax=Fluctibacter corallii TaxID=2984329 RepID=A0ABT3A7C7_9ALTE|nr:DNA-3-methyladenine glycosylase I [Aestuariibacter sp. AA17]MCV2884576.1 DNA-3-methyladenine glycosylase I [Aestuariibacter sp. AA17]